MYIVYAKEAYLWDFTVHCHTRDEIHHTPFRLNKDSKCLHVSHSRVVSK